MKFLKQLAKSRTIWAAVLFDIIGVLQLNTEFMKTILTPTNFGWFIIGMGITQKILRMLTTQSLGDK